MILADIKGKLSLKEWYSEDFLTSTVFSTFIMEINIIQIKTL